MKKVFFTVFVTLFSCTKQGKLIGDKYIALSHRQTYCADQWTNVLSSDSLTLKNVAIYLGNNNLYVAGLSIKQDTLPDICNACNCRTGKTIYATTLASDSMIAKYNRLGFK